MARNNRRSGPQDRGPTDAPRVDDFFYDDAGDAETDAGSGSAGEPDDEARDDVHRDHQPGIQDDADHDLAAAARRGRRRTAARWARAVAIAGAAALTVYAAGSGAVGPVDLAAALGKQTTSDDVTAQSSGVALVTESSVVCPGPGQVGLADPAVAEPEQRVVVSAGSAPVEALPHQVDASGTGEATVSAIPRGRTLPVTQRGSATGLEVNGATWVRGTASGALAAGFAASQLAVDLDEQERGLSTTACWPAQEDLWLVAGGSEPGRVERLVLVNPTGNPVTADVEVLGADGPVEVVGGRGIVVPPSGREVVLLDALAPGEQRPAVHITTTGGPLAAALADRWLEGTLDRGLELTTPTASPALRLLIPAAPGPRPESADSVSIRVGVPGEEQAVVQVRVLTADGPQAVANDVTNVGAGAVTDIDVSDLPVGTQAIEVVADTPVVAAVHVERRTDQSSAGDLAWVPAVTPSAALVGAPLPLVGGQELERRLSLASLDGAVLEVAMVTDGVVATREVDVPAAGNVTIDLEPGADGVWVRVTTGEASAAVVTTVEDDQGVLIAAMPLPEAPVTRQVRSVAPWLP